MSLHDDVSPISRQVWCVTGPGRAGSCHMVIPEQARGVHGNVRFAGMMSIFVRPNGPRLLVIEE